MKRKFMAIGTGKTVFPNVHFPDQTYHVNGLYTTIKSLLESLSPPPYLYDLGVLGDYNRKVSQQLADTTPNYNLATNIVDCDDIVSSTFTIDPLQDYTVLPPCRICGEKASGFHYGANTCEACKGFFRRGLRRHGQYKCSNDGKCEISASTRGQCGACRYKKCINIGMSKKAIKTGRYTHEKKSKDLEEVRQIMQQKVLPSPMVSSDNLLQVIYSITSTHLSYSKSCVEDISVLEEEHLKVHAMQEKLFGSLKPISQEEYLNIYRITGMDVDGRKDLLERLVPLVDHNLRKLVAVAKTVPGFNDLPVEDKIMIIKTSRFEAWMILHHKQFNPEKRLFTTILGTVVCGEDMCKVHDKDFIESLMSAQIRIKSLQLGYEEMCVLAALAMMSPDRCKLSRPSSVEAIQDLLLRCLIFWFGCKSSEQGQPSEDLFRLTKMVDVLVQLRSVSHLHDFNEENLIKLWFDKVQISPLIYEMWAL